MTLQELVQLYAMAPAVKAFRKTIEDSSVHSVFLDGLVASSSPMLFAAVACSQKMSGSSHLFILPDEEEAGYFYHDLKQIFGEKLRTGDSGDSSQDHVLFFPSSYRRAIKFAQRDSANEILRTEVLAQLSSSASHLFLVTYPSFGVTTGADDRD